MGFLNKQVTQVVAFFIALSLIIGCIWYFGHLKYQNGVQDTEAAYQQQVNELNEVQRSIEREAQNQVNKVMEKAANDREQTQSIIDSVSADNDRLRQRTENLASQLRQNASTTATLDGEAAAAGWTLFGSCTKRYEAMGAIADKQRDDLAEWKGYGEMVGDFGR